MAEVTEVIVAAQVGVEEEEEAAGEVGGVSLNKEKLAAFDRPVTAEDLIDGKYLLVQRGKKNYYLIIVK